MTVTEGPAQHDEKELQTRYPVEEGLILGTTKQVGKKFLHPEVKSLITADMTGVYRG